MRLSLLKIRKSLKSINQQNLIDQTVNQSNRKSNFFHHIDLNNFDLEELKIDISLIIIKDFILQKKELKIYFESKKMINYKQNWNQKHLPKLFVRTLYYTNNNYFT